MGDGTEEVFLYRCAHCGNVRSFEYRVTERRRCLACDSSAPLQRITIDISTGTPMFRLPSPSNAT
jgi:uncharacterized protein (DUF983 family)